METPRDTPEQVEDAIVDNVRDNLEQAESAGDEARLETLEGIRRDLEAELDSSLENGTPGH